MNRNLTVAQKIHWAESCNEIEYEYALHAYYNYKNEGKRPGRPSPMKWADTDCIIGSHSFGAMIGYQHAEVGWSSGLSDEDDEKKDKGPGGPGAGGPPKLSREQIQEMVRRSMLKMYPQLEPTIEEGNVGRIGLHSIASSIIEVAEDGMSARASFYTPGIMGSPATKDGGQFASIMWERYGTDWVFENGEWCTIHNLVAEDFTYDMDHINYARDAWDALMETGIIGSRLMGDMKPKGIDIRGPGHMNYSPVQVPQYNAIWPEPYDTLNHSEWYVCKPGDGTAYTVVFEKEGIDYKQALLRWFGEFK